MKKEQTKPPVRGKEITRHYESFREPKHIEEGGVINLSGKFLLDHETEIVNLIKHQADLAEQKNPDHRLTRIDKVDGGIVAGFSNHNLAMHVGKALANAYKGEHQFKFLKGEKFVEVDWKKD
ncbi:MAG: hypothetical protein ABIA67_01310 [Candidatus Margulisiibacteriota bacterium]